MFHEMFFSAAVMKTNPISYHRGLVFMDRPEVTEAVGKIRFMERCLMLDESMKFMALARYLFLVINNGNLNILLN